jgi:hypothetical protein
MSGLDDVGDDGGGDHAPHDGERDGLQLLDQRPAFRGPTTELIVFIRKDAGENRAESAADAVHAEGVERVVVAEDLLQVGHREERHDAGQHAHDDGRNTHETGAGGDDHETGDDAGAEAEDARLAAQ